MATDVAFKVLKIVGAREARYQKWVPHLRSARKETLKIDFAVISSYVNSIRFNRVPNLLVRLDSFRLGTKECVHCVVFFLIVYNVNQISPYQSNIN